LSSKFSLKFGNDVVIPFRSFLLIALLFASTLSWWLLVTTYFTDIFKLVGVRGFWANIDLLLFYGFGAFFAFAGSSISHKIQQKTLLVVLTSIPFFSGLIFSILLSVLLGFTIGFGFPSVTAILGESTKTQERGRVSGAVILVTFILTFVGVAIYLLGLGIYPFIAFCVAIRAIGFIPLFLYKPEKVTRKITPWKSVLTHKNFILYLVPWILFSLTAGILELANNTLFAEQDIAAAVGVGVFIQLLCMAFSGLVAGSIADRFGRRQPIVIALIAMGFSFGLLGLVQIPLTVLLFYSVYGIAWGFLFTVYLTISADLSPLSSKEKYYALSTMVPLTVFFGSSWGFAFLGITEAPVWLVSPILSAITFLSIIPVWRANESLPVNKINERKLREHIEKVGKLIEESKE
jgi:MFS family permease